MSGMIKVSVIVCAYNAEIDLPECLQSLQGQDYEPIELIVVDDDSKDGTGEALRRFISQAKTALVTATNSHNLGVAGSRNVGINLASGDIIAFTDADCVADRRWISELVKGFSLKDAAAVGGGISSQATKNIWELLDKGNNFVASQEGYVSYIQGCNMSFRAEVLKAHMFNAEIKYGFEETLLCDELIKDGCKIYYRPQAVVHHKSRKRFISLWKLKYRRGLSSVWYRNKRRMFFMYVRHLILLLAILCLLASCVRRSWLWLAGGLFLVFAFSLLRDEIKLRTKSNRDLLVTFPFLLFVELAHFWGSLVGVMKFRILKSRTGR
jgi:glycosyltransferase involved in cell wall biosynthesis